MDRNQALDIFYKMEELVVQSKRALQIVTWDWRAITPKAAAPGRAGAMGVVSDLNYRVLTDEKNRQALDYLSQPEELSALSPVVASRVRELKKQSDHQAVIPSKLFAQFTRLQSLSEAAWEKAKKENDWPSFAPHLQNMFDYTNRFIDLWGYEGSRYNALLGFNEEGMTTEKLDALFDELGRAIVPLIRQVHHSSVSIDDSFTTQVFPVPQQRAMATALLEKQGFRRDWGVLAESEHPYTTSFGRQDVRMTTHYYEDQFLPALFSTLHEGGHGIYEQNIDPQLDDTIVGRGLYSGMHESVSRFWENMIGRSLPFWECNIDWLRQFFPQQLKDVTPQQMYLAVNKVGTSLTRIEADELTYNLHIRLRYELERDVFDGKIQVKDLPQLWKEKMEEYLGLTPPDDRQGILQDIQWSMAQFGYFPAYALGNLYNAQYTHAMRQQMDLDALIRQDKLPAILEWKREHLYRFGLTRTPEQTMIELTGQPLRASYLADYLVNKFTHIYQL